MEATQATALVARLAAAHPRVTIEPRTIRVYADAILDCSFAEADRAVRRLLRRSPFFPSIAEIRLLVAEDRLALPSPEEAWAQARRYAAYRRAPVRAKCSTCDGSGFADDARTAVCADCRGEGTVEMPGPAIHPVALAAFDSLGGTHAYHATDEAAIFRAQFLKTYRELRAAALDAEAESE